MDNYEIPTTRAEIPVGVKWWDGIKLRPCPFCGGEATVEEWKTRENNIETIIRCKPCRSSNSANKRDDGDNWRDIAVERWNSSSDMWKHWLEEAKRRSEEYGKEQGLKYLHEQVDKGRRELIERQDMEQQKEKTARRAEILEEAKEFVCGEHDYGPSRETLSRTAELWRAYMDIPFTPKDVAMLLALSKAARVRTTGGSMGCCVDLAGYAACAGELAAEKGG